MKESMNAAFGHVLAQVSQEPEIKGKIKGKLGASLASAALSGALVMVGLLGPGVAQAQGYPGQSGGLNSGCVIGSVAGGVLGHQVGGGSGKTIATALGAVAGCVTGSSIQNDQQAGADRSPRRERFAQRPSELGSSAHPMGAYAPACIAQWNGEAQPRRPLSREASAALAKGEALLSESHAKASDALELYAEARSDFERVQRGASNPYNNMSREETIAIRGEARRAHSELNQVSRHRQSAEREYAGNTLRVLDACEYAAAQGEDVRAFAGLQAKMTLRTVDQWTLRHPITGVNVRVATGGGPARLDGQSHDLPKIHRP